jgi:hypothetical protein
MVDIDEILAGLDQEEDIDLTKPSTPPPLEEGYYMVQIEGIEAPRRATRYPRLVWNLRVTEGESKDRRFFFFTNLGKNDEGTAIDFLFWRAVRNLLPDYTLEEINRQPGYKNKVAASVKYLTGQPAVAYTTVEESFTDPERLVNNVTGLFHPSQVSPEEIK